MNLPDPSERLAPWNNDEFGGGVRSWRYSTGQAGWSFMLVFVLLAASIVTIGYHYYRNYERNFYSETGRQLSVIADLKVEELVEYRKERLGDANTFYNNSAFSELVRRFLQQPADADAQRQLQAWLGRFQTCYEYARINLFDVQGAERLAVPDQPEPLPGHLVRDDVAAVLRSGRVTFLDFHRDAPGLPVQLEILAPIFDGSDTNRPLGVLVLRINPEISLYPFIQRWPTPSRTAETLLVRREGNEAVFLNELRFQTNTALNLRISLENTNVPAVKAVLGQTGIVEGRDYRGEPVIADVRAVPGSPWFMVAHEDVAVVFAPVRERFWQVVIMLGVLIFGSGAGVVLIWRRQRVRFYREKYKAEADRARLGAIVEFSEDAIIGKNLDGTITSWNAGAEHVYGYSAAEVVGKSITILIPPGHPDEFTQLVEKIKRGEAVTHYETGRVRKNGERIQMSLSLSPVRDEAGTIVGVSVIGRDITGRKLADEAVRESEERYRLLFAGITDGVFVHGITDDNLPGQFLAANDTFCQWLGYTREELLRLTIRDIDAPESTVDPRAIMERLKRGKKVLFEQTHVAKDGRRIPVEINAQLFQMQGRSVILSVIRDITVRKQAEEALHQSQAEFKDLFDNAPVGFHEIDAEGRLVRINNTELKMLGYSAEELLGQFVWKISAEEETTRRSALAKLGGEPPSSEGFERKFRRKDGSTFPVLINDRILKRKDGAITGIHSTIQDITERKQAEEALRDNEAFLNTVIEKIPHMIFVKDAKELRFVKFNKAGQELLGYSLAELAGKNDYDLFPKEMADYFTENDRKVLRGKEVVDIPEEPVQTRNKGGRILHTKKIPVFDNAGRLIYLMGISEDITERKRAEKQLRQLSSAVEHSPASIVITDPAGNIEYVNPKFTAVTGYSSGEVIGKNPRFLKSGETPAVEYERLWQTITSGREWRGEFHNRKKNGGLFWETASISSILDDSSKIAHFVAVKEDITEVKQSREKLRQRESFLSAITENQPGLLWLKDAEGRFLTVNKAFAAACGRSDPEQVCGLTDLDLWPKEMAEKYRNDDRRVMSTGDSSVVEEMIFIGDKYVWHETFKTPVRDDQGCVIGTTGYARDITGRKRAEQQLTEAFNFNRKIISDASVGIVVFKASGSCVLANETAARTLNATVPQILAQDFRQIASWRASGMLQFAEEALATKEPRHCESNFTSTFGKEVSLVCHFSPFVQNGEPHLLLVFNDVSEKKKLEAQFLRAQRMESIGTLAGGIAHDLNNVLAPLLISVQLLKEKVTDADGKKLLETLEANVNRGANLVKQVLIFGRGIRGERIMLQPKHIGREIEHIVHETFPKSVKFEIQFAADLWTLTGDPTQIEQVLLNLSVNARDAMPDGGKLSLHMENRVLDENYAAANLEARPGNYVVISVTDTGAGMTREIRDRIFEPFYTTKEQGKGTGLGLSTTLAIVKSHGGFINCYSEAGKGSVFTVYLPASPGAAVARKAAAKQSSLPRGHNELVLVVDDEAPIRILAQSMLERFGYRVLLAADGAEAVKLYISHQNEIAVVITDMAMPVMDGPATIAALQAINPKVKVIGSSGLDIRDGATGIINAGLRHFMSKPYTAESMLNLLHKVLRDDPVK